MATEVALLVSEFSGIGRVGSPPQLKTTQEMFALQSSGPLFFALLAEKL